MSNEMKVEDVLALEIEDHYDTITIREFMHKLLKTLLEEGENFSGKRALGNSGWEMDLAYAYVKGGAIKGTIEYYDDGDISDVDFEWSDVTKVNEKCLNYLFLPSIKTDTKIDLQ